MSNGTRRSCLGGKNRVQKISWDCPFNGSPVDWWKVLPPLFFGGLYLPTYLPITLVKTVFPIKFRIYHRWLSKRIFICSNHLANFSKWLEPVNLIKRYLLKNSQPLIWSRSLPVAKKGKFQKSSSGSPGRYFPNLYLKAICWLTTNFLYCTSQWPQTKTA